MDGMERGGQVDRDDRIPPLGWKLLDGGRPLDSGEGLSNLDYTYIATEPGKYPLGSATDAPLLVYGSGPFVADRLHNGTMR
jgi:hypothetical protein